MPILKLCSLIPNLLIMFITHHYIYDYIDYHELMLTKKNLNLKKKKISNKCVSLGELHHVIVFCE